MAKPEWISCLDQLPPKGEVVLVCDGIYGVYKAKRASSLWYGKCWVTQSGFKYFLFMCNKWQPLTKKD